MSTVNITVDGRIINADTEKTLLDNITDAGIFIPHLCHNKELESYGGCGLCLVEVEGIKKPLRACSAKVTDGMVVATSTPAIEKSRKATLAMLMSDHGGDCKSPCYHACPTHQDIQAYVALIADGKSDEALEVIKKDNPLPASIGRVCPHPCEKKCRRAKLDGAVSICSLKRFAADSHEEYVPECDEKIGKKAAVIGAGPAGLSCAYFLLLKGCDVDIFESEKEAGGMLRYAIPEYRLPKSVLKREIGCIEKMGAKFHYSKRLGRDFTVASLKEEYDTVFVATGAWLSSKPGCENDDAEGVIGGIDFLYKVANGDRTCPGERIAVIGGGNTAIDAVRTAVRLGAKEVTLIYRRTREQMPAEAEEIIDAEAEGVKFRFLSSPLRIETANGKVSGIVLQDMKLGEPDESGRQRPVAIEGSTSFVECDAVISAIGQHTDTSCIDGLELTRRGTVAADEKTFETSFENVFAAGDMINKGSDIAIRAIAGGKNAAMAMYAKMTGAEFTPEEQAYSVNEKFDFADLDGEERIERTAPEYIPLDSRIGSFDEVVRTFSQSEAMKEASRCLECGCASVYDCQLLPLARKYGAFDSKISGLTKRGGRDKSHPFIVRDNSKCILCAQCVRACREIAGVENLGLYARGFLSEPICAFDTHLGESRCISCGVCVDVCPTGALTSRTPALKNPVLPFSEEEYVCRLCGNNCRFTRRKINGVTVAMIPESLKKRCSLGTLFLPAVENGCKSFDEAAKKEIYDRLTSDISLYEYAETLPKTFGSLVEQLERSDF